MIRHILAAALAVAASACAIPVAHAGVLCYLEASAGKNVTATRVADVSGPITIDASGLQGGGGIGCDYTHGQIVVGILGRYDFQDLKGAVASESIHGDATWMAALRAGWKLNEGTLLYGLGGIAGTDLTYPGALKISPDGVVVGGGLEIDLGVHNISLFVEVDHIKWSKSNIDSMTTLRPDTDIARIGIKIKLDVLK